MVAGRHILSICKLRSLHYVPSFFVWFGYDTISKRISSSLDNPAYSVCPFWWTHIINHATIDRCVKGGLITVTSGLAAAGRKWVANQFFKVANCIEGKPKLKGPSLCEPVQMHYFFLMIHHPLQALMEIAIPGNILIVWQTAATSSVVKDSACVCVCMLRREERPANMINLLDSL